jgi:betaine lipid synthase
MASLGGNILPPDMSNKFLFGGIALVLCAIIGFSRLATQNTKNDEEQPSLLKSVLLFCYSCFLKPHKGDGKGTQQDALESFYQNQAGVYDVTRKALLKGREDMLALVAAQLAHKAKEEAKANKTALKRVWVDVGSCFPVSPWPLLT